MDSLRTIQMTSQKQNPNTGIITFRVAKDIVADKTIVITGPSRSGTTMMAQVIQKLGVNLGEVVDVNLFEDIEIRKATKEGDIDLIRSIVGKRNEQFESWGWKFPGSLEFLSKFADKLRNPFYIFTFRDPIATTVRNQLYEDQPIDMVATIDDALNYMKIATEWVRNCNAPCMCVSYEKALLNPDLLVNQTSDFLQLNPNAPMVEAATQQIQLGNIRYLSSELYETHLGFLDSVESGLLQGWANDSNSNEPAKLEIRINLKKIATIEASDYRKDLEENKIRNGNCAFQFNVTDYLQDKITNRIEVCFAESGYPLQGSPAFLTLD
jgi:hypothetical protein